ncbi:MAG: YhbY family RNA-binding protein [Saccharofermentanales bacterium]|nr:YhbY family RNA-binding protein [Clostridiaceae bacterium]
MMTGKQRAWLRGQANDLPCLFQVGKGEITRQLIKSLDDVLSTHELLKVNILKTVKMRPADLADQLALAVGADVVQVIGHRFVLYRRSEKMARLGKSLTLPV